MTAALDRLRDLVAATAVRSGTPTWVDGMSLFRSSTTTQPLGVTAKPTLGLVLQGAKRSVLREHVYDYAAGQFLVVTLDLPLVSQITRASAAEPFVAFGMPLRASVIAALLLEADAAAPQRADGREGARGRDGECEPGPALAVSDADDELLGCIERLLRLHRSPADYRVLAPGVLRELHWRLVTGPQGALVRQIGVAESRLALVAKAVRWIQANFDQPLSAPALAAHVGLSVSTLNRHFRAATSLSPLQYQKTLRLQQARLSLLNGPKDVAGVGHAVGYDSPSQFSREYRRMFGVAPSADAGRSLPAEVEAAY